MLLHLWKSSGDAWWISISPRLLSVEPASEYSWVRRLTGWSEWWDVGEQESKISNGSEKASLFNRLLRQKKATYLPWFTLPRLWHTARGTSHGWDQTHASTKTPQRKTYYAPLGLEHGKHITGHTGAIVSEFDEHYWSKECKLSIESIWSFIRRLPSNCTLISTTPQQSIVLGFRHKVQELILPQMNTLKYKKRLFP